MSGGSAHPLADVQGKPLYSSWKRCVRHMGPGDNGMKRETSEALTKITTDEFTAPLYKELLRRIKTLGSWSLEPQATSLDIVNNRPFLSIQYRKDGLLLNLVLDRALDSPRV